MGATTQALDTGQGASIAFTTASTFAPKVLEIPSLKRSGDEINGSHLGTSGDEEFIPGDLIKNDELAIPILWNTNDTLPAINSVDTLTITWALRTAEATAANIAGTCIIKGIEYANQKLGELQMGSITVKFDGYTGPTYTKGA
jgi:hypothetical protein